MRMAKQSIVVGVALLAAVLATGCSRNADPPLAEQHPPQSAPELKARLTAAAQIPVKEARDSTLQQIARDSAVSAQPELCATTLGKITAPDLRHATAEACAATLSTGGDKAGAEKVRTIK